MLRRLFAVLLLFVSHLVNAQAQNALKIVYFDAFPPYSYVNNKGQMEGILVDIAREVLEHRMGLEVSHQGLPWARAQSMVKNGQADAFISVATSERLKYVDAALEPVVVGPITLFTKNDPASVNKLVNVQTVDDLKPLNILDYSGNGWGNAHFPETEFQRILLFDLADAFNMLAKGRGDVIATDKIVANHVLKELAVSQSVTEVPTVLDVVAFSLCIGKQSPYLSVLEAFSAEMEKFRAEGGDKRIVQKYQ